MSGVPPGAIRFLPVAQIPTLRTGLCIVLYDIRSGVTRVVPLNGRGLVRCAEAFGVQEKNTPLIAREILRHGPKILLLTRVGIDCTGFSVDVNRLPAPGLLLLQQQGEKEKEKEGASGAVDNATMTTTPHGKDKHSISIPASASASASASALALAAVAEVSGPESEPSPGRQVRVQELGRKELIVDSRSYRLKLARRWYKDRVLNAL